MLFSNNNIQNINWDIYVSYISGGYQQTSLEFSFTSLNSDDVSSLVIPTPWSPDRIDGGIKIIETNCEQPIDIIDTVKKLRTYNGLDLMFIEDIKTKYVDNETMDCGYLFLKNLKQSFVYKLIYTFKICPNSCLFTPVSLPFLLFNKNISRNVQIKTQFADYYNNYNAKHLKIVSKELNDTNEITRYEIIDSNKCNEDFFFHVSDWLSSDDELNLPTDE